MRFVLIILLSFSIFGISCTKEPITGHKAYLANNSSQKIQLWFYKSGTVHQEDTLLISPKQTIQIGEGFSRGISHQAGFSSHHFGIPSDSVIVVFNDSFFVTHYSNTPHNLSNKFLLFSSDRNVMNKKSYVYEYEDENKNIRNTTYTYTFTEKTMILRKSSN